MGASPSVPPFDNEHQFLRALDGCKTGSTESRRRGLIHALAIADASSGLDFAASRGRCSHPHCTLCEPGAAAKLIWFVELQAFAAPVLGILSKSHALTTPRDWVSAFRFVLTHQHADCAEALLRSCPRGAWLYETCDGDTETRSADNVSYLIYGAIRYRNELCEPVAIGLIPHATDAYLNQRFGKKTGERISVVQVAADFGRTAVVRALVARFPGVELDSVVVRGTSTSKIRSPPKRDLVEAVELAHATVRAYERELPAFTRAALDEWIHIDGVLQIIDAYAARNALGPRLSLS